MGITFDITTRHKGQTLELKVLDVSMCNFLGLSVQVIINLRSPFNYYYCYFHIFIYLQYKDFIIMYLHFFSSLKYP